jgi:hypothetical protein
LLSYRGYWTRVLLDILKKHRGNVSIKVNWWFIWVTLWDILAFLMPACCCLPFCIVGYQNILWIARCWWDGLLRSSTSKLHKWSSYNQYCWSCDRNCVSWLMCEKDWPLSIVGSWWSWRGCYGS